jgi:O-antigen/teichoic acid export membrane protein
LRISFAGAVGRLPQSRYKDWLSPAAVTLDGILHDSDDRSVSRRIALIAFSVRILSAVIAYVSQILLARWMGDFEYGIFVAVWVGAVVLGGFACLGFQTALLRFVPEYVERGDASSLRGVIVGSRVLGIVASTLFAALGAAGLYAFGDSLSSYYLVPLYLGAITLPMLAIGEIQDGVARSFYWANLSFWPTFIIRPVLILAFMWLAVRFGAAPDAITAMVAVIAATYVTSLGQLASVERRVRKAVPDGPRRYRPALWIGIALPIFIVEGFFNLLTNIDIIIVSFLMEPDRVAVYFAAAKTLALVHFVYFAVRAGGAQRFSKYYASGDRGRLEDFVRDTLHWTFWPSLAMVSLLLLFGRPLLGLFGPNFIDGYPLLFIISIGLVVRASIGPAESLLTMAGQHNICAAVYTAAFALSVALNFALIPRYGLQGAAAATTLALVAEAIAVYVLTVTRLGIHCSIVAALWPRRAAAGAS